MKQTKLRRRRVFRYAVLYFVMLVVFLALIVGPIVAGDRVPTSLFNTINGISKTNPLVQPNNDTLKNDTLGWSQTGTAVASTGASATPSSTNAARMAVLF